MPKAVKTFVHRYGGLISVFYLGSVAVLKGLADRDLCGVCDGIAGGIQTAFGLLALTPDPALGPEILAITAGGFAVYSGSRKVASIVKKKRAAGSA